MERTRGISALAGALALLLSIGQVRNLAAQQIGSCEHGQAEARLDINGVSAAIYNNGNLFWGGFGPHYEVPKGSGANAIFATNLWIGGLVDGELRISAADYGPWEMWPGPLDKGGNPPEDCSEYDRIYKVSRYELIEFDRTGVPTGDIADWPWQLGAPVEDGDGIPDNYDLEAGDRPKVEGDQTLWWVMNDLGNNHGWSYVHWPEPMEIKPLGIEVRVTAFAASSTDREINYTTFYRYQVVNKASYDIEEVYFGMFHDVDLGNAGDDYMGSDTTHGVAYVWNGDDFDDSSQYYPGYGDRPPGLGFTVISGPLVDGERLGMSTVTMQNHDSTVQGHPQGGADAYRYLQALWRDGEPMTVGGTGRGFSETPTKFLFSGRPPEFWSEEDTDGYGSRNTPADRNLHWSTGPFMLRAGGSQEITFAILFAQGEDRFESVYELIDSAPRVKKAALEGIPPSSLPRPQGRPDLVSPADGVRSQPRNMRLIWSESSYADQYEIEVASADSVVVSARVLGRGFPIPDPTSQLIREVQLPERTDFRWRVRGFNASGFGPWSAERAFSTNSTELVGPGPLTIEGVPGGSPAFVQIQGIGDDDACGPNASSTFGCAEVGGNSVFSSFNGQADWIMYQQGAGPEASIGAFAPHDFELRVTDEGSFAYHPFDGDGSSGHSHWVPLETWDIGDVGPFGIDDPTDNIRLIPAVYSDDGGVCVFGFGEIEYDPFSLGWPVTDRVYALYPTAGHTYADWEALIGPLVEQHPDGCPLTPETDSAAALIDLDRGRPLQRLIFMMDPTSPNYRPEMIPVGNVIRFYTTRPVPPQQSAPAPQTLVSPPFTLYWQTFSQNDSSRVQLLKVGESISVRLDRFGQGGRLTVEDLEPGLYYWRLSNGDEDWSEAWSFLVVPSTRAEDDGVGPPTALELKPPYPNPGNGPRFLVYGVPGQQRVSLAVYDLLGRRVEAISDGERIGGWYTETWDPKSLSAGVYFVRVESDGQSRTQPVVVTR